MLKRAKRIYSLQVATLFGFLTAGLYSAIFLNTDLVMKYFTKGGIWAILPVGTALIFSFVHGAFTGHFWNALGIEPSRKVTSLQKSNRVRPRPRPRLYLRAE